MNQTHFLRCLVGKADPIFPGGQFELQRAEIRDTFISSSIRSLSMDLKNDLLICFIIISDHNCKPNQEKQGLNFKIEFRSLTHMTNKLLQSSTSDLLQEAHEHAAQHALPISVGQHSVLWSGVLVWKHQGQGCRQDQQTGEKDMTPLES